MWNAFDCIWSILLRNIVFYLIYIQQDIRRFLTHYVYLEKTKELPGYRIKQMPEHSISRLCLVLLTSMWKTFCLIWSLLLMDKIIYLLLFQHNIYYFGFTDF